MNDKQANPFHPDLRRIAPFLPRAAAGRRSYHIIRQVQRLSRHRATNVEIVDVGAISIRVHRPPRGTAAPHPALLWIHGGGYVIGDAAQDDSLCALVAERLGALVASVEYRLAPEHPFPVPLDDCYEALGWLTAQTDVDEHRVAIGGASAGGGLAAALALLARDRDEVRPALQLLSYPMLDDRTVWRTDIDERNFRLWNCNANRFAWEAYLGTHPRSAAVPELAAPARSHDLSGVAPAWIGVGTLDLFYDEDLDYAKRLGDAGVDCHVEVVKGAFHGFDSVRPNTSITRHFRSAQLQALTHCIVQE